MKRTQGPGGVLNGWMEVAPQALQSPKTSHGANSAPARDGDGLKAMA